MVKSLVCVKPITGKPVSCWNRVVGRKNWFFSGTPEGAEASALPYSLVETAKANKLESYAYLRFIFDKLPMAETLQDYEDLQPWNVDPKQMDFAHAVECS